MIGRALFAEIRHHLDWDETPSVYLNAASLEPAFSEHPFDMLLRLKQTEQSRLYHPEGNAWNHTMLVVDAAAVRKIESHDAESFMWAALLHDIGKPPTTRIRKGRITAYDHDLVGAELAKRFLMAFTDDSRLIQTVTNLVRYHMHVLYVLRGLPFANVPAMKHDTDVREVALLGLCDRLGRTDPDVREEEQNMRLFMQRIGMGGAL